MAVALPWLSLHVTHQIFSFGCLGLYPCTMTEG
nr:MAG TPA: hypothetical protein [Caudoviricetes sp.]